NFRPTSFLINKHLVLDAGSITGVLGLKEQLGINHIVVTHAHVDHSRDLMFLADNIIGANGRGFILYSIPEVLKDIKKHFFNWRIWPDLTALPDYKKPVIKLKAIKNGQTARISKLKITLCKVNHTVPTAGVIIDDGNDSVVFSADTAPTAKLWSLAAKKRNLKGIFIECSYPEEKNKLASISKHLTPSLLGKEIKKIGRDVMVYVYHIKPQFYNQITKELKQQNIPNMKILKLDEVIHI
ncbi:MAG: MBL fold metallo-hydrolase, partial [bacterium]